MNEIFDWEQIPKPSSTPTPSPPLSNPLPYDYDFSIFPPSSHEGLHEGLHIEQTQPAELKNPPSPQRNAANRSLQLSISRLRFAGEIAKQQLLLGFEVLYSKLLVRANALSFAAGRAVWSFAAGVVGMLFLWWLRRRRVALAKKEESILLLIRDNEKKIDQLLHQIAQIQELISTQRRVPILRSA